MQVIAKAKRRPNPRQRIEQQFWIDAIVLRDRHRFGQCIDGSNSTMC